MRLLFTILLLSLPIIEIWCIFKLGALYGWWFFLYMILVTYLGWRLIKEEKQLVFAKLMGSMTQGGNPIKTIKKKQNQMVIFFEKQKKRLKINNGL